MIKKQVIIGLLITLVFYLGLNNIYSTTIYNFTVDKWESVSIVSPIEDNFTLDYIECLYESSDVILHKKTVNTDDGLFSATVQTRKYGEKSEYRFFSQEGNAFDVHIQCVKGAQHIAYSEVKEGEGRYRGDFVRNLISVSSSNPAVLSVELLSSRTYSYKGLKKGYSIVSCKYDDKGSINTKINYYRVLPSVLPHPTPTITLPTTTFPAGGTLALKPVVSPTDLNVDWSIESSTAAGAKLDGNVLSANGTGTVTIRATIQHGIQYGKDFTKDFVITVTEASSPAPSPAPAPAVIQSTYSPNTDIISFGNMRLVQNGAGHFVKEIRGRNDELKKVGTIYTAGRFLVLNFNRIEKPINIEGVHWEWLRNDGIDNVRCDKEKRVKDYDVEELAKSAIKELWFE